MTLVRGVEAPLRSPSASSLSTLEDPTELTVGERRIDLRPVDELAVEVDEDDGAAADGAAEVEGESESVSSLGEEPLLLADDDDDEWWWCLCCNLCRSDGIAGCQELGSRRSRLRKEMQVSKQQGDHRSSG